MRGLAGLGLMLSLSLTHPQRVEVRQNVCGLGSEAGDPVVEGAGDDVVLVLKEGVGRGVEEAGVDRSRRDRGRPRQHCVRLGVVEDTPGHAQRVEVDPVLAQQIIRAPGLAPLAPLAPLAALLRHRAQELLELPLRGPSSRNVVLVLTLTEPSHASVHLTGSL